MESRYHSSHLPRRPHHLDESKDSKTGSSVPKPTELEETELEEAGSKQTADPTQDSSSEQEVSDYHLHQEFHDEQPDATYQRDWYGTVTHPAAEGIHFTSDVSDSDGQKTDESDFTETQFTETQFTENHFTDDHELASEQDHASQAESEEDESEDSLLVLAGSENSASTQLGTWIRFAIFACMMACLAYFAPAIVEEFSYRIARGRQRGQHDFAAENLHRTGLQQLSSAYQLISQRVRPSVVHIKTEVESKTGRHQPFDRNLSQGQGSGVIVSPDGYILTNGHVIDGSRSILVKLSDGRRRVAEVVGVDELTDIAVLKVDADHLISIDWADSDKIDVGAMVWAFGSPFGLEKSITFGIISAKHRSARVSHERLRNHHQDFLQTDAAVNPGNSGGPLVDTEGRLVGINTAIVGDTYQGISFSVPSNVAKLVFERIRRHGRVPRGWLGVALDDFSEQPDRVNTMKGARVTSIPRSYESPAASAGVQVGDVITAWNGTPIDDMPSLIRAVAATEVGTTGRLQIQRNGSRQELDIMVAERPKEIDRIR